MSEKDRKELNQEFAEKENDINKAEEKKLNNYDTFVDQDDNSIHEDIETVMRKYDRESNTRIWTGKPKVIITVILAAFSLWCI